MGLYDNFLNFFENNKSVLFSDAFRPAKSITRNIITGVDPFKEYYTRTNKLSFDEEEIAILILHLDKPSSTSKDNIRNMMELKFMSYQDTINGKIFHFTRNFIDFIRSGASLETYIINQLSNIKSLADITMFYNCILCALREGVVYGEILHYPDSFTKFCRLVPIESERKMMCEKVYDLYGFKSRDSAFGTYTPNANYRFTSTCVSLGLIKEAGLDVHGIRRFVLTNGGHHLLSKLNENFK